MIASMLLYLMTLLGCSSAEITRIRPPDLLMQPCGKPVFTGHTYGDLVHHAVELRESLDLCDQDKTALRKWAEGVQ